MRTRKMRKRSGMRRTWRKRRRKRSSVYFLQLFLIL